MYATASRNGEPYAALIERKGFLPSVTIRICSSFLKRDRIDAVARHRLGLKRWHSVIGLLADERRRVIRMRTLSCGSRTGAHASLPLADAGVREAMSWLGGRSSLSTSASPATLEIARSKCSRAGASCFA